MNYEHVYISMDGVKNSYIYTIICHNDQSTCGNIKAADSKQSRFWLPWIPFILEKGPP